MSAAEEAEVPTPWVKRESKSRPGNFYFFNPQVCVPCRTRRQLWAVEFGCWAVQTGDRTWERPTTGNRKTRRSCNGVDAVERASKRERAATVRARHLLIKHRDSRKPFSHRAPDQRINATLDEARAKLKTLRARIVQEAGQDSAIASGSGDGLSPQLDRVFTKYAEEQSDCSSAKRGGDLGEFTHKQMQAEFSDAAFSLEVGQLSDVVASQSGVHIILRLA